MVFECINIRQVPREVLKTEASGLGIQHLPWDLSNVNALKTMFDPYSGPLCCSALIFFPAGVFSVSCRGHKRGRRTPVGSGPMWNRQSRTFCFYKFFSFDISFDM